MKDSTQDGWKPKTTSTNCQMKQRKNRLSGRTLPRNHETAVVRKTLWPPSGGQRIHAPDTPDDRWAQAQIASRAHTQAHLHTFIHHHSETVDIITQNHSCMRNAQASSQFTSSEPHATVDKGRQQDCVGTSDATQLRNTIPHNITITDDAAAYAVNRIPAWGLKPNEPASNTTRPYAMHVPTKRPEIASQKRSGDREADRRKIGKQTNARQSIRDGACSKSSCVVSALHEASSTMSPQCHKNSVDR